MIFYALLNAAYRVSLHGPGAELEGGGVFKHPSAQRVRRRAPAPLWLLSKRGAFQFNSFDL